MSSPVSSKSLSPVTSLAGGERRYCIGEEVYKLYVTDTLVWANFTSSSLDLYVTQQLESRVKLIVPRPRSLHSMYCALLINTNLHGKVETFFQRYSFGGV